MNVRQQTDCDSVVFSQSLSHLATAIFQERPNALALATAAVNAGIVRFITEIILARRCMPGAAAAAAAAAAAESGSAAATTSAAAAAGRVAASQAPAGAAADSSGCELDAIEALVAVSRSNAALNGGTSCGARTAIDWAVVRGVLERVAEIACDLCCGDEAVAQGFARLEEHAFDALYAMTVTLSLPEAQTRGRKSMGARLAAVAVVSVLDASIRAFDWLADVCFSTPRAPRWTNSLSCDCSVPPRRVPPLPAEDLGRSHAQGVRIQDRASRAGREPSCCRRRSGAEGAAAEGGAPHPLRGGVPSRLAPRDAASALREGRGRGRLRTRGERGSAWRRRAGSWSAGSPSLSKPIRRRGRPGDGGEAPVGPAGV